MNYRFYLLMDIDIPWIKDDLRDKPNERKEMFDFFKSSLIESQKSFNIISGNFEERKEKAISIINNKVAEIGAKKNLKIVDLTGAGDLFAAGYLHGFINNLSVDKCLQKGTELSSKIIQQIGARL